MNYLAEDIVHITPRMIGMFVSGTVVGMFSVLCIMYYIYVERKQFTFFVGVFFVGVLGRLMSNTALIIGENSDVWVMSRQILQLLYAFSGMVSILSLIYLMSHLKHRKYHFLKVIGIIGMVLLNLINIEFDIYALGFVVYTLLLIGGIILMIIADLVEDRIKGKSLKLNLVLLASCTLILLVTVLNYSSSAIIVSDWLTSFLTVLFAGAYYLYKFKKLYMYKTMLYARLIKDSLTGCYAKNYMIEQINACENGYVVFADFNKFKLVNDFYGHQKGDVVLILFAQELKKIESDQILSGRFGGDEFILLFSDMAVDEVYKLIETIMTKIKVIFESENIDYESYDIGISFGIAPINGTNNDSAVFRADKAMYSSKEKDNFSITTLGR